MTEPTIDDMLAWLDTASGKGFASYENITNASAIRAILEQHRNGFLPSIRSEAKRWAQQLRREFVERVEARIANALPFTDLEDLMHEELAAMEKETNAGTND